MTPEEVASEFDVSRETLDRLRILADRLRLWTRKINLVSAATLPHVWARHIADSAQLFPLRPTPCETWVDLGVGAGFPGLVIAAMAADTDPRISVTLVESDARKAAFLADAARAMDLAPTILPRRIESLDRLAPSVLSARALAPLPDLLAHAERIAGPETTLLFPKGASVDSELTAARHDWHITCHKIQSRTESGAAILRITGIERKS